MPAYNASKTLKRTLLDLPLDIVDEIILVDDCSDDDTCDEARKLGIKHIVFHSENRGYGANQKSCYEKALELEADIVIMVHPDYQYDPKLVTSMASLISNDIFDCVMASRILGVGALKGGMPFYKYLANRLLTFYQNLIIPYKLSEYHSGYRAFSRKILEKIPISKNSDDFIFDNQMLLQIIGSGYQIGEITCPTRYLDDSSSINLNNSVKYGLGVLWNTILYKGTKLGFLNVKKYKTSKYDK